MTTQIAAMTVSDWINSLSVLFYVVFTGWVIYESRASRKSMLQPVLVGHISRPFMDGSRIYLLIENIGNTTAFDVRFNFDEAHDGVAVVDGVRLQVGDRYETSTPGLVPGRFVSLIEGLEVKARELKPFSVRCSYTTGSGKKVRSGLVHFGDSDFCPFTGSRNSLHRPLSEIEKSVRATTSEVKNLSKGASSIASSLASLQRKIR